MDHPFKQILFPEYIAESFSIVGFRDLKARCDGTKLEDGVELADPEVLFHYDGLSLSSEASDDKNGLRQVVAKLIEQEFSLQNGYRMTIAHQLPSFHVHRLTGSRYFVYVLTIYETRNVERCIAFGNQVVVPKFLVFLSNYNLTDFFRCCFDLIYLNFFVQSSDRKHLDELIATLVKNARIPLPGITHRFSFGLEKSTVELASPMPLSPPNCSRSVYRLFYLLGIDNVVDAVKCLLNEAKVIVYGKDPELIATCCDALMTLLWPLPYKFIYSPCVGRRQIGDILNALPSSFCIGTSHLSKEQLLSLLDDEQGVVLVNLQDKSLSIPGIVREGLLDFDDKLKEQLNQDLSSVFASEELLLVADGHQINVEREMLIALRLRASFLRVYAAMLSKYRRSFFAIRFCPRPRIIFDKAHFLGEHGLQMREGTQSLTVKLVDTFFHHFQMDRCLPFRTVDVFDHLCAKTDDVATNNVVKIAKQLMDCEKTYVDTESFESFGVLHLEVRNVFPMPEMDDVSKLAAQLRNEELGLSSKVTVETQEITPFNNVPISHVGEKIDSPQIMKKMMGALDRFFCSDDSKMENLTEVDHFVFSNISAFSVDVRRTFCRELSNRALTKGGRFSEAKFKFITSVVKDILCDESEHDEHGIAGALLVAATRIDCSVSRRRPCFLCKKFNNNVVVYLYQQLDVKAWANDSFWAMWLGRSIASGLAGFYSDAKDATAFDVFEADKSMEVLAKKLSCQISGQSEEAEEEAYVVALLKHCIQLMITVLFYRDQEFDFNTDQCNCRVIASLNVERERNELTSFVSWIVEQLTCWARLPASKKSQIMEGIAEQINMIIG